MVGTMVCEYQLIRVCDKSQGNIILEVLCHNVIFLQPQGTEEKDDDDHRQLQQDTKDHRQKPWKWDLDDLDTLQVNCYVCGHVELFQFHAPQTAPP